MTATNTTFDDIHDLTMLVIQDFKLNELYDSSPTNFNTTMDGLLIRSLSDFTNCVQDLTDYTLSTRTFDIVLTLTEKMILSKLQVITWLNSKILDVMQLQNWLNDTDFRTFSSAQNLKAKMDAREILREEVSQNMTSYGLTATPWTDWGNGVFE